MAKLRNVILVEIDPEQDGSSCVTNDPPPLWDILKAWWERRRYHVIVKSDYGKVSPPIAAAHEFGHVIGNIFQTKAACNDPRPKHESQVERDADILVSEREAWDFAEISFASFLGDKSYCLRTYEDLT